MKQNFKEVKDKYIQLSGELFEDVQLSGVFKDSKTFVDAIPLKESAIILNLYDSIRTQPDFDLYQFVNANFKIPEEDSISLNLPEDQSMEEHIENLWEYLVRNPDEQNKFSTLIPLEYSYIVPGGRFREIYYWDSFFTILGLLASNKIDAAENMVKNFSYLIKKYKMIPNGNRIYYLTRSQPPFFTLMIDAICRYKNDFNWGLQFLNEIETEYLFWMDGINNFPENEIASERVLKLENDNYLNRYFDSDNSPREESFKEDFSLAKNLIESDKKIFYQNIRAAAESGWDFSSRWFEDGKSISKIQTTNILPVDLNCLIYFMEERLSFFYELINDSVKSKLYKNKFDKRAKLINKFFWNEKEGFYFDYNFKTKSQTKVFSLAGIFPLYFGIANQNQAEKVAKNLSEKFLKAGGLVTTLNETKQQWDASNGWAPLQWMAIKSLREYELNLLADKIKKRWLALNENVYKRTNKMFEKYNVEDISLFAGGGEYQLQDGFGWTNGVAIALIKNYDEIFLNKYFHK